MISDQHYSPIIDARLQALLRRDDFFVALPEWLSSLSRASFRTAGYMIGERLAPSFDAARYWLLFLVLVDYDAKAFLVTMLKSLVVRMKEGSVSLADEGFRPLAHRLAANDIDRQKTFRHLLPHITQPDEMRFLFRSLQLSDEEDWIPYLVDCATLPAFYLLFLALRRRDHDRRFLMQMGRHLVKQGDSLSFNMASLLHAYFSLDGIGATFSLSLAPYELSRVEMSYPAFCQIMRF